MLAGYHLNPHVHSQCCYPDMTAGELKLDQSQACYDRSAAVSREPGQVLGRPPLHPTLTSSSPPLTCRSKVPLSISWDLLHTLRRGALSTGWAKCQTPDLSRHCVTKQATMRRVGVSQWLCVCKMSLRAMSKCNACTLGLVLLIPKMFY